MKRVLLNRFIFMIVVLLFISGCSSKMYYNHPSKRQPHALLVPIKDTQHKFTIFGDSTIFILEINGKDTNGIWQGRNVARRIAPGPVTIYVEDDNINVNAKYIFAANLSFNAKAGETYTITTKYRKVNSKVIDADFYIINRNRVIKRYRAEKIKRAKPVYVPIFI